MKVEHHQEEKLPTRSPFSLCCGMFLFTLTSLFYSSFFFHLSRFFWKRAIHFSFKRMFIWFTKKLFREIVQSAGVFSFLKFRKGNLTMFIFSSETWRWIWVDFLWALQSSSKGKEKKSCGIQFLCECFEKNTLLLETSSLKGKIHRGLTWR